jgi:hypothetical protein
MVGNAAGSFVTLAHRTESQYRTNIYSNLLSKAHHRFRILVPVLSEILLVLEVVLKSRISEVVNESDYATLVFRILTLLLHKPTQVTILNHSHSQRDTVDLLVG